MEKARNEIIRLNTPPLFKMITSDLGMIGTDEQIDLVRIIHHRAKALRFGGEVFDSELMGVYERALEGDNTIPYSVYERLKVLADELGSDILNYVAEKFDETLEFYCQDVANGEITLLGYYDSTESKYNEVGVVTEIELG